MDLIYSDENLETFMEEYPDFRYICIEGEEYSVLELYPFRNYEELRLKNKNLTRQGLIIKRRLIEKGWPSHEIPSDMTTKECLDYGLIFMEPNKKSNHYKVFMKFDSWYIAALLGKSNIKTSVD